MELNKLSETLGDHIGMNSVFVFDGECVLCSAFFRFILKHDQEERFQFVIAQSQFGTTLYQGLGLDHRQFETNFAIIQGAVYQTADAFAAVMAELSPWWRIFRIIHLCRAQ